MVHSVRIDNNILMRLFINDEGILEEQYPEPREDSQKKEMEEAKRKKAVVIQLARKLDGGDMTWRIPVVVISEAVWTLKSYYQKTSLEIADVLITLAQAKGVEMDEKEIVMDALQEFADKNVDFIDAYQASHARKYPPELILTWDTMHFKRLNCEHMTPEAFLGM